MATSQRLTAPAADAASILERELRRMIRRDGIVDIQERRLLRLSQALTRETNRVDCTLRECERDFDPEPDGPATKRAA